MFIASKNSGSKVFHNQYCSYVKQMSLENKRFFYTEDEARAAGFRKCSCCSGMKRHYEKEKSEIVEFSLKHNIKVEYSGDVIDVDTAIASWRIVTTGPKHHLKLLHANDEIFRICDKTGDKVKHNYHKQNVNYTKIMGYLRYIVKHDDWKIENAGRGYKNMPHKTKKQKKAYNAAKARDRKRAINMVCNIIERLNYEEQLAMSGAGEQQMRGWN